MKIAFNASPLLSPLSGIGQYALNLARELQTSNEVDLHFFYSWAWSSDLKSQPSRSIGILKPLVKRWLPQPYELSRMIQQRRFSHGLRQRAVQLYHEPSFVPFRFPGPTVITVHDLSWIRYPQAHPPPRVALLDRLFPRALQNATHIIVPTEFVKQELIDVFGLPVAKISTTLEAARSIFQPRDTADRRPTLQRHGLKDRAFFLSVGTLEPRKNIEAVLKAHAALPEALRKQIPLAVVGMRGWLTSELETLMAGPTQRDEVMPLGFVGDDELADIYSSCIALIYPSLYEGFGLPVLEAMACGVPVITSNVSSLPEVTGSAAITLAPDDIDGIRDAMMLLYGDASCWNDRAAASLAQANKFSWARCARETIDVYRKALANA